MSLENFIQKEILQGENAYYCEKCDWKVTSIWRTCIAELPSTLFVVLKWFEIDYAIMQHTKLNDKIEFPNEINMMKYSREYIEYDDLIE